MCSSNDREEHKKCEVTVLLYAAQVRKPGTTQTHTWSDCRVFEKDRTSCVSSELFWEIRNFSVFVGKETSIPSRCTFIRSPCAETTNCADSYNSSTSEFRDTQESYLVGLRCFRDIRKFAVSIEKRRNWARSEPIYMHPSAGKTTSPSRFRPLFSQQARRHESARFLILERRRCEFCDTKKIDKES
jgi:hypothetical protein